MVNLAYIDDATFELEHPHRDVSVDPTSTVFAQWIKSYSTQINNYLGTQNDIAAFGDNNHKSRTIVDAIATLLEARFVYSDDLDKTPLTERGVLEVPRLKMRRFIDIQDNLDTLKGADPTVSSGDPPAFNFDLDTIEGGFD